MLWARDVNRVLRTLLITMEKEQCFSHSARMPGGSFDTLRKVALGVDLYCQDLFRPKKWGNVGREMGLNVLERIADSVGSIASFFSCVGT